MNSYVNLVLFQLWWPALLRESSGIRSQLASKDRTSSTRQAPGLGPRGAFNKSLSDFNIFQHYSTVFFEWCNVFFMMPDAVERFVAEKIWNAVYGRSITEKTWYPLFVAERFFLLGCVWTRKISTNGHFHRATDFLMFSPYIFRETHAYHSKLVSHIPCYPHEIPWNPNKSHHFKVLKNVSWSSPGDSKNKWGQKKKQAAANQISLLNLNFLIFDRICWFKKKHSSWLNPHFYTPNFCSSRSSLRRTWREGSWWWNLPPRGPRMDE